MRLSCPNCGATYLLDDRLIPRGGRHVQCTACHTRWFARGVVTAELATPAEDQVIARLEARNPTPRPVPTPAAAVHPWPETPPAAVQPAPEGVASPVASPDPDADAGFVWESGDLPAVPADAAAAAVPPRPAYPPRAEPSATLTPAAIPPAARRLSLNPAATAPARPAARRSGGRFVLGFLCALLIGGAAFAAYEYHAEIADRLPAARPVLERHVALVDQGRTWVDTRVTPEIDRLLNR
jgi:predicted Zn finger-like uncharacterized protein